MKTHPILIPAEISRDNLHISLNIRRRKQAFAVALLAPEDPAQEDNGRVRIEWLVGTKSKTDQRIREQALREIDYFLLEKGEPLPWSYLIYHCSTSANFYGYESGGIGWILEPPATHRSTMK